MYKLSETGESRLATCHEDIQKIVRELLKFYDVTVIEGHRTKATQLKYFREGKSKLDGMTKKSKHQSYPSMAIDLMPYKRGTNAFGDDDKERARFYMMMGMVKAIAEKLLEEGEISHGVRFGLDWDGDMTFKDQTFDDLPHFELT